MDPSVPPADGLTPTEREALADEAPVASGLAATPSALGHFQMARQASTYRAGPAGGPLRVEVLDLETATGKAVGTSPWHVVSANAYPQGGVSLWGATLTDAYKMRVDAATGLSFVDRFEINALPTSIPWNLGALADGRIVVPDQNGYFGSEDSDVCGSFDPSFLVLGDDPSDLASPIRCEGAIALSPGEIRDACGVSGGVLMRTLTGIGLMGTFDGHLGTLAVFDDGGVDQVYLVLFDVFADTITSCGFVDDSVPTNEVAAEPVEGGGTEFYLPTGDAIVKMRSTPGDTSVTRVWERPVPVRERTGTTPTLVDTPDGERFVVTIDAKCAVVSVVNGLIACNDDASPSRLLAVRRDDAVAPGDEVVIADLPEWLDTAENSPAARRGTVVVANYSGYLPNGLELAPGSPVPEGSPATWLVSPDASPNVATGIVAMAWDAAAGTFVEAWSVPDRQVSGVPTISAGANLVYGSGAEEATGRSVLYGFRLFDDESGPGGAEVLRVELGDAPFRTATTDANGNVIFERSSYNLEKGELYDGGNNQLVLDDGSLILTMASALVRVSEVR